MMQINCAVDSPEAARAAIDGGADWITLTPPPLPPQRRRAGAALLAWIKSMRGTFELAHERGLGASIALAQRVGGSDMARHEVYARLLSMSGADALALADLGLMRFMRTHFPQVTLHAAPQASIGNAAALGLLREHFGVTRACLPGTTPLAAAMRMARGAAMDIEILAHGSSGGMLEGLCSLSAFFSGTSATRSGACPTADTVRFDSRRRLRSASLNDVLVDVGPASSGGAHPTICNGRYLVERRSSYPFGGRDRWAVLEALAELGAAGVRFLRIAPSGADAGAARRIVQTWRAALARCAQDPAGYRVRPEWRATLGESRINLPCTVSVTAHP